MWEDFGTADWRGRPRVAGRASAAVAMVMSVFTAGDTIRHSLTTERIIKMVVGGWPERASVFLFFSFDVIVVKS